MSSCLILVFSLICCERAGYQELHPANLHLISPEVLGIHTGLAEPHAIEEAWLFIDDLFAGAYPLPSSIPILETGPGKNISIYAGIRDFGIRARPEIYTLLDPFLRMTSLEPDQDYDIKPVFRYKPNLAVFLHDGFESGNPFMMDLDSNKQHHITRTDQQALTGQYSGLIRLSASNPVLEAGTAIFKTGASSYLEMSVQSSIDCNIGLQLIQSGAGIKDYFFTLKATGHWKTIYIPLREILDRYDADTFQLLLRAEYPPATADAYIYLDLIKIISLP